LIKPLRTLRRLIATLLGEKERYVAAIESTMDGYAVVGAKRQFLDVNAALCALTGYSRDELLRLAIPDVEAVETEDDTAAHLASIAASGRDRFETRWKKKDGAIIDIEVVVTYRAKDGGEFSGFIHDITARKRAELELRRKTELAQLMEALAREANEAATPEPALRSCLARICEHGNWTLGHVAAFAQGQNAGFTETSLWHRREPGGRYEDFIGYSDSFSHDIATGQFAGLARRERRPVWIEDLSRVAEFRRIAVAVKHGLRAGLALPVIVNGEVTAFLEFFAETPRPADSELMAATESAASMLARLIERERALNALREREHLMRLVTENVPAMIAYFDAELRCRFANTAFCEFHHLGPQGVTGMTVREITGEDTYRVISPSIDRIKQGKPVTLRRQERTATGEIRHIEIHRVPDMSPEGEFLGYYAMVLDITEQMRAEEVRAQLAAIVENSGDAIWSRSLDGKFLSWNAAATRLFGWTRDEVIGRDGQLLLVPPEYRHERGMVSARLARGEDTVTRETVRLRKDGTRVEVEARASAIRDAEGNLASVAVTMNDITGRKRAEEANARLAAIVESSNDAIMSRALDLTILTWNAGAGRLFGWTAEEAIGRPISMLIPPDREEEIARNITRLQAGLPLTAYDTVRLTKDGRRIEVSVTQSPIKDGHGEMTGVSIIFRDITERRRAEEARRELEVQLREAQKLEAIGTLAGGIAHDFNNILGAIIGNAVLARRDLGAGHPALVGLDEIYKSSQRAKDLVQQILTFSRRQPQQLLIQPLRSVVEDAVKLLRATLPAGVELAAAISDTPLYVHADATQIEQVVLNLCTNAWHAMKGRAGRIEIGLDAVLLDAAAVSTLSGLQPGRYACLSVRDNGCGMDAAMQARIFEPFFTTKAVGQGTGLGLSVVHGIVKAHHGAISLESAPGAGATFRIYFPAVAEPRAEALPEPAAPSPARLGSGQHVLYVDDDGAMVFLVIRMLEGSGYRVSGYELAAGALAAVRAAPGDFDLVVTDFNMPGLSGLAVAQELARIRPELPVVITSGYITEELRAKALQAGVRHLIHKPDTVDELCEVIQRLLATGSNAGDLSSTETTA